MNENHKIRDKFSKDFLNTQSKFEHHISVMERIESLETAFLDAIILRIKHCAIALQFLDPYNFINYTKEEDEFISDDIKEQERLYQDQMNEVLHLLGIEDMEERKHHFSLIKYSMSDKPFHILYEIIENSILYHKNWAMQQEVICAAQFFYKYFNSCLVYVLPSQEKTNSSTPNIAVSGLFTCLLTHSLMLGTTTS